MCAASTPTKVKPPSHHTLSISARGVLRKLACLLILTLRNGKSLEPYFWIPHLCPLSHLDRPPRHPCFHKGPLPVKGIPASHLATSSSWNYTSSAYSTHALIRRHPLQHPLQLAHHHTLVCQAAPYSSSVLLCGGLGGHCFTLHATLRAQL